MSTTLYIGATRANMAAYRRNPIIELRDAMVYDLRMQGRHAEAAQFLREGFLDLTPRLPTMREIRHDALIGFRDLP